MQDSATAGAVNVPLTIRFRNGTIRTAIPVPAGETNLTQLLPILRQFTSGIAGQASAFMEQNGQPVSCGPNCTACCYQMVPVTPFEAESLANWIRTLPENQQHALAARFHAALLELQSKGVLARLTPEMFDLQTDSFRQLALDYFVTGVACPFLVEGLCSIHPIRPLVCREYMVVTPPEYCAEPGHARVQGVALPMQPSRAMIQLGKRVEDDAQGWLPLVFLFHWMAARSDAGKWVSGTGPAVLTEFLNMLAQQPGVSFAHDAASGA